MRHAITKAPTQVTIRLMAKSRSIGHLPRYSVEDVGVFGFGEPLDSFAGLELPHKLPQREFLLGAGLHIICGAGASALPCRSAKEGRCFLDDAGDCEAAENASSQEQREVDQ